MVNARLYNSIKRQTAKIRKDLYGRAYNEFEDVLNSLAMCIDRDDEKVESVWQALGWTVETGRMPIAKQAWLDDAKGSQVRQMFERAAGKLNGDMSMAAAKKALFDAIPA